jgi:hypothetical protein
LELQDYLKVLKRRKWVIIEALLVVVAAAVIVSLLQTPVYEATTTLLIREKDIGSTLFGQILPELSMQPERSVQTQLDLVKLKPILGTVIEKLDLSVSPEQLMTKVSVEARPQTNLMVISVEDGDPKTAARIADVAPGSPNRYPLAGTPARRSRSGGALGLARQYHVGAGGRRCPGRLWRPSGRAAPPVGLSALRQTIGRPVPIRSSDR